MKFLLTSALIFLSGLLFNLLIAQTSSDTIQVIIGSTIKTVKQKNSIKEKIIAMPHIRYVGYCSNHDLYIIYANKNFYNDKTDFFNQVVIAANSAELLLKEGEIKDIVNFCEYEKEEDYNAMKKALDN